MTRLKVLEYINKQRGAMTWREFAEDRGLIMQQLHKVAMGKRPPDANTLKAFGIICEVHEVYKFKKARKRK